MLSRSVPNRRNSILRSAAIAVAIAITASVTACAQNPSETPATTAPESVTDKTLRFAAYGPPIRSFDPHRDGRVASNLTLFAVYDRLIGQSPDGELIPQLATEWEFSDDTTFEMVLRDDVTFHDGEVFDAEAVKANIERAQTIDDGAGPWAGPLSVIESIEVADPTHLTFRLKAPTASLPATLSDQAGAMISPAAFDTDLAQTPVGAGPYVLEKWTADGSATFTAYEDYWAPETIGAGTIEMPFQLDQLRRLDMFKADEIDATFGHTTFVAGAKDAGLNVNAQPGINYWFIDFNRANAPFDDVNVRRAINHALDQESLIKALLYGEADANEQPFNEKSLGFSQKLGKDVFPYDPEKSKKILADAGYENLTFECAIIAGSGGAYAQYAEVVKDQLAKAGITMDIKLVESQSTALLIDKSVNCAMMPYGTMSPILNAKQLFSPNGYYNAGKVADDEMIELLDALDRPQSEEDLRAAFGDLAKKVADDALFTSLFFENWTVLTNDKVEGLEFYLGGHYTEFRNFTMK